MRNQALKTRASVSNHQTNDEMKIEEEQITFQEMIIDSNENSIRECYVRIERLHTKDLPELYESASIMDSNKCNLHVDHGQQFDKNNGNIKITVPNAKIDYVKIHGKVNFLTQSL